MKQKEFTKCMVCSQGVAHGSVITFYRIKIDYLLLNLLAIQRQAGLEVAMGSPGLAAAMGPNEDLAKEVSSYSGLICFSCALEHSVAGIHEAQADNCRSPQQEARGPVAGVATNNSQGV